MEATIQKAQQTYCKYNGELAVRFDLQTPKGILSKTINKSSQTYKYLSSMLGSEFEGKLIEIELKSKPKPNKPNWVDVTITKVIRK